MNEFIIIISLLVIFSSVVLCYRLFGKNGLFALNAIITVLANIEVLILVRAFGIEQTLGNILFAATFLITDILSENEGKKEAQKAVNIGVFASCMMLMITGSWLLYQPSANDWAMPYISKIFAFTPRLIAASLLGYLISQKLDVFLYHVFWRITEKKTGDKKGYLWFRNNAATMISQLINTVLFNSVAFLGIYSGTTLLAIMLSSYIIYVFTSFLDTPFVYFARFINKNKKI